MSSPLSGRVAVVTGVSRRNGIGYGIATRLAADGASLFVTHRRAHDEAQPWGGDDLSEVLAGLREALHPGARLDELDVDLAQPEAPAAVIARAVESYGHVDILVANHALSGSDGALGELTADMLDRHWAINARSSILLAQAFAAQHDGSSTGRVVFFTSGQELGPMPGEVAYTASKAAIAGVTLTIADQLAPLGITVNCVNPGPVDTGYADEELRASVAGMFPLGRWGTPDDPARLVAWLVSDEGRWMTGQVLNSEGGFRRWAGPRG